ncbi:MAG: cytidine deaminase [FCB group bacterium]|nr:cytidine deaminase [FCB group bacterium]
MMDKELIERARNICGEFKLSRRGLTAGSCAAALRAGDGKIYTGICLDLACGIGFCAEHAAIADMLKERETRILTIVAVNSKGIVPPCGRCRELMFQVNPQNRDTQVILAEDRTVRLSDLLPEYRP